MAKRATSERNERRIHVLPKELLERIRSYQEKNHIPSEVEAVRRLLNEALQNHDSVEDILNRLDIAFAREKDLRILARDILSTHILIKNIVIGDNYIEFSLRDGSGGQIFNNGFLRISPESCYPESFIEYIPPYKRNKNVFVRTDETKSKSISKNNKIPF